MVPMNVSASSLSGPTHTNTKNFLPNDVTGCEVVQDSKVEIWDAGLLDLPTNYFTELNNSTTNSDTYKSLSSAEHRQFLWDLPSPDVDSFHNLPDTVVAAAHKFSASPGECLDRAEQIVARWEKQKITMTPAWRKGLRQSPPHVRQCLGDTKNGFLIDSIIREIGHTDVNYAAELQSGFDIIGDMKPTGVGRPHDADKPLMTPHELLAHAEKELNSQTLRQCSRLVDVELQQELYKRTLQDIKAGVACEIPLNSPGLVTCRFPNDEGHRERLVDGVKTRVRKVRACGNFRSSLVNVCTRIQEKYSFQHLDCLTKVAKVFHLGGHKDLRLCSEDFSGAYNSLPLNAESLPFAQVAFCFDGTTRLFQSHRCPFGAVSSVRQWVRTGSFVQNCLSFLNLPCAIYVDDLGFIWPERFAERASRLVKRLISGVLGWELDPLKANPYSCAMTHLGVAISLENDCLVFSFPKEKKEKWELSIRNMLKAGKATSAEMAKTCGRLGWAATFIFGRGCRWALRYLYSHKLQPTTRLSDGSKEALKLFLHLMESRKSVVPLGVAPTPVRAVLYVDAVDSKNNDGGLGFTVETSEVKQWSCVLIPAAKARKTLHFRKKFQNFYEALALVCGVKHALTLGATEILVTTDNKTALKVVRKGMISGSSDINNLVRDLLYEVADAHKTLISVWCSSNQNLSDGPSRWLLQPEMVRDKIEKLKADKFEEIAWPKCPVMAKFL